MLITPHQVAMLTEHRDAVAPATRRQEPRWTWIAGRRFQRIRRL